MADRSQRLAIIVTAQDLASGKLGKVKGELTQLGATGKLAALGLGGAGLAANRAGAAFGTLKGRVSGLFSSIGPLLGVGGLLGLTGLLSSSVREAADFGANVSKVAAVTGLAAGTASAMVDTLDKWGVSADRLIPMVGKLEKNVGAMANTKKKAIKFEKEYGLSLLDGNGKIADANTLLLRSADYFNGHATASQKATVMSKLWGKSWQDMVPILQKGSKFIRAQEADAIHLTKTQLANIAKFRDAQRNFSDAFGDVQVKIGSELMPLLTSGLKEASAWFDSHGDDIAAFFRDAAGFAGQAASGAIGVFNAVKAGWDSLPKPLRDMLITGLVAQKSIKFLFGVSLVDVAGKALGSSIGGALGGFFQRGSPANPMFTKEVGLGGPGGPLGKAGGAGLLGALAPFAALLAVGAGEILIAEALGPAVRDALGIPKGGTGRTQQVGPLTIRIGGSDAALFHNRQPDSATAFDDVRKPTPVAHPGGVDSPRTVAASTAAIDAIMKRSRLAGFKPKDPFAAAEATNQRNLSRAAERQQLAADRLVSAALALTRAGERLENVRISVTARGFAGVAPKPGHRVDDTGGGSQSGVLHGGGNAAGLLGFTRGRTDLGYAGEAGGEAVAIIRHPRAIGRADSGMGREGIAAIVAAIARLERRPVVVAARSVSRAQRTDNRYSNKPLHGVTAS